VTSLVTVLENWLKQKSVWDKIVIENPKKNRKCGTKSSFYMDFSLKDDVGVKVVVC